MSEGMNPALQQALQSAEAASKQSNSGNPMELNAIPGNIGKGFGQTPGYDKPIGQGVGATTIQDTVDQGNFAKIFAPALDGLKSVQTLDNSTKIDGNVMTAPTLAQSNIGGKQQQGGPGQGS